MGTAKRSWKRAMVCGVSPDLRDQAQSLFAPLDRGKLKLPSGGGGFSADADAEAEDRDDAEFAGGERLDEVRDKATEHHHRMPDGEADAHGAVAGRGADAGERLVLAGGVKAREDAGAALVMAVEQAGDDGNVACFDVR